MSGRAKTHYKEGLVKVFKRNCISPKKTFRPTSEFSGRENKVCAKSDFMLSVECYVLNINECFFPFFRKFSYSTYSNEGLEYTYALL